jgi:alcohol dehydrogenase class IV
VAGIGSLESIGDLVKSQNASKVLIATDIGVYKLGHIDRPKKLLEAAGVRVEVLTEVVPEPTIGQAKVLISKVKARGYDMFIGIGGGSSLDVTKLLAVGVTNDGPVENWLGTEKISRPGAPTLLVPTTAGTGSEATPNAIITLPEQELKVGIVSRYLLPTLVILDPSLTLTLPKDITAATGMDAFIHSLESYISKKANPISDAFALRSMRLIANSIREAYSNGQNLDARHDMLIGSLLGGMALTSSGTAAVHALAYPLGGKYGIPHGLSNSMLLIPVMEFNFDAIHSRLADVAEVIGLGAKEPSVERKARIALDELGSLVTDLSIPKKLAPFGVRPEDLDYLATSAAQVTRLLNNNPKPVSLSDIRGIYSKLL